MGFLPAGAAVQQRGHRGLHRLGSFVGAGLRVRAGSDAPYGDPDPWLGVAAAADRRTAGGRVLGAAEALTPGGALRLWCDTLVDDVVVLDAGWDRVGDSPPIHAVVARGRWTPVTRQRGY